MDEDRVKIAIMDWDDQFEIAMAVLTVLQKHDVEISEELEEELILAVTAFTDEFSTGDSIHD